MATLVELFAGRTETVAEKSSAEIAYMVRGAADEAEVKSTALASIPASYAGLPRKSVEIAERINNDTWKVLARYETQEFTAPETPQPAYSFDTGGGTQHITQSLQTIASYPAGTANFQGAIGWDGEHVQGVDITVPVYNFAETIIKANSAVTDAYKAAIFNATGKTNNASFRSFAIGELLFLGASGSRRGNEDWEITFRFAASPNRTGIMVGGIGPIAKKGWEYLWVQYGDSIDTTQQKLIKVPVAAYVERVYDAADFSTLGLG